MNISEAKALGLDALRAKAAIMKEDIDRDPNVWTVVQNAISELEWEAQQTQQHEERVQQSIETLQNELDSVDIHGLTIRELCAGEQEYQLLSIWFKERTAKQTETLSKQINDEIAENKRLREQLNDAIDQVEAKDAENRTLKGENAQIKLERDQAIAYRDNAVNQVEEAVSEVKRLESQVDDLRKEIAIGARNAVKVVDVTSPEYGDQLKQMAEKIKNSKVPVTVLERSDMLGKEFRVVLAETGEEKIIPYLQKGNYRLVSQEEAAEVQARFRAEEARKAAELAASVEEETVPVTFPEIQAPDIVFGVDEDSGISEAAEGDSGDERTDIENVEPQTIEERVADLEKRMNDAYNYLAVLSHRTGGYATKEELEEQGVF